jgi:hypothetical protein
MTIINVTLFFPALELEFRSFNMANYCEITKRSYTQSQIDTKLRQAYEEKHSSGEYCICQGCGMKAHDNSHTISQKRCKHIHKVCLIWDLDNIVDLCRKCHQIWEIGGEEAKKLFCYEDCMAYLELHDQEGYLKRIYLK